MGHHNLFTESSAAEAKPESQMGLWTDTSVTNPARDLEAAEPLPENCFGGPVIAPEADASDSIGNKAPHPDEAAAVELDEDELLWARLNAQAKPQASDILDVEDDEPDEVLARDENSNASSILDKISKPIPDAPVVERPAPEPKKNGVNQAFDVNTLMQLQDAIQDVDVLSFVSTPAPVPVQKRKQRQYVIPESDKGYVRPALVAGPTIEPAVALASAPQESIPASEFVPTLSKELMVEQEILSKTFRVGSGELYKTLGIGSEGQPASTKQAAAPPLKEMVKAIRRRRPPAAKAVVIIESPVAQSIDQGLTAVQPANTPTVVGEAPRREVQKSKRQMRQIPQVASTLSDAVAAPVKSRHVKTDIVRTFTKTGVRIAAPAPAQLAARSVHQPVQHPRAPSAFVSTRSTYLGAGSSPVRTVGMPTRAIGEELSSDDVLRLKISQTVQQVLLMRKMLAHYFEA